MSDRQEPEWRSESFDVASASDQQIADAIRDCSTDLFFLLEVAKVRGLAVGGCQVEGEGIYSMGTVYPSEVAIKVSVIKMVEL